MRLLQGTRPRDQHQVLRPVKQVNRKNRREVTKREFDAFISSYDGKLVRDVCGIYEPAILSYNDFEVADRWPASVVAWISLGLPGLPLTKKYYLMKQNREAKMSSIHQIDKLTIQVTKTSDGLQEYVQIMSGDMLTVNVVLIADEIVVNDGRESGNG